jgi:hypothetical protein
MVRIAFSWAGTSAEQADPWLEELYCIQSTEAFSTAIDSHGREDDGLRRRFVQPACCHRHLSRRINVDLMTACPLEGFHDQRLH